jgi:hypothetical protein
LHEFQMNKHKAKQADLRPPLTFTLGVVGHRALAASDLDAIMASAKRVFAEFAAAANDLRSHKAFTAYHPGPAELRCLSGLAEGADCLLAEAALASGWSLRAVLPFPAAEFEKDFSAGGAGLLRSLLPRAADVCELGARLHDARAYLDVGEYIVEHSQIVVAVWNGEPARGPGGTGDVIARALRAGRPVLAMDPADPTSWRWLGAPPADTPTLVRDILTPPGEGEFPHAYFKDSSGPSGWAVAMVGWLDKVLAYGAPTQHPASAAALPSPLRPHFERADSLAVAYGARYRAAGLFRYGLIIPATAAALIAASGGRAQQAAGNLAQFLILIFLVAFSSARWQGATHARFVDYRLLAEQFRGALLLEPFAALPPWLASDWTSWLVEAYARAAPPAFARQDEAALKLAAGNLRTVIVEQIGYLKGRAARYEIAARRLSRIGTALSALGVVFAGLRGILLFEQVAATKLVVLNTAALVLPALAPVFLGLLSFNEYRRNAARYRSIAGQLERALASLDRTPLERAPLLFLAGRVAQVLRNESSDWRTLTRIRTISAF